MMHEKIMFSLYAFGDVRFPDGSKRLGCSDGGRTQGGPPSGAPCPGASQKCAALNASSQLRHYLDPIWPSHWLDTLVCCGIHHLKFSSLFEFQRVPSIIFLNCLLYQLQFYPFKLATDIGSIWFSLYLM